MTKNVHVVPNKAGWSVKTINSQKSVKNTDTQKEAIEVAKRIAKNNQSELLIYNKKNRMGERNSYGNNPFPKKSQTI